MIEQSDVFAFVVASEGFVHSRPYLKDTSAAIRRPDSKSGQGKGNLKDVCQLGELRLLAILRSSLTRPTVWALRGWSDQGSKAGSAAGFELRRVDGNEAPKWEDVEHKHDGKYRLRYNPAKRTEEISQEDLEAVRLRSKEALKSKDGFKRIGGDRAALEAKL